MNHIGKDIGLSGMPGKGRFSLKGRGVDPIAPGEVQALLGSRPLRTHKDAR